MRHEPRIALACKADHCTTRCILLHHSAERRHTDSNYSVIFPLFDYLFRTATWCPAEQHKTMILGLAYFREQKYARLDQLLLMPFQPKFANLAVQSRRSILFAGSEELAGLAQSIFLIYINQVVSRCSLRSACGRAVDRFPTDCMVERVNTQALLKRHTEP